MTIQSQEFYELYKFQSEDSTWYYTSHSEDVVYDGNTYSHVAIARSGYSKDISGSVPNITIKAAISEPFTKYLVRTPLIPVSVNITRKYEDGSTRLIFSGNIYNVSFENNVANVVCKSALSKLEVSVPRVRFQSYCNNSLYDSVCGKPRSAWTLSDATVLSISASDSIVITVDISTGTYGSLMDFTEFTMGTLEYGNDKRLITKSIQSDFDMYKYDLYIQKNFEGIAVDDTVSIVRGCDKRPETCRNVFGNFANFVGMPYMPFENPVVFG